MTHISTCIIIIIQECQISLNVLNTNNISDVVSLGEGNFVVVVICVYVCVCVEFKIANDSGENISFCD